MDDENVIDFTKLKYVLYARKSTVDESRQIRSIPDQIAECEQLARRLGLNVIEVLEESQSAKKPNLRPVFRQMLTNLKKGIYDAILAWNPDRLARNMLEGGEIIDMIDQDQIKDLKFVTHYFTKDANGKMLLGMAFVLSKQYSDDLSQKVERGVKRRFLTEGKTPVPKYGYINEEGLYRPDNEGGCRNFDLMCEAWQMRKKQTSIEIISNYLNEQGLYRLVKHTGEKLKMEPQKLSDIFHDSFYYGVLNQAKQQVDLRELYDFEPAVSEDDWNHIQSLSYRRIKPSKPHKLTFYPLRLMVLCLFCGMTMRVGASKSRMGKRLLYYRCDNKNCTRKKKSIRSKAIFVDFLYKFVADGLNFTEAEYKKYYEGISHITDQKRQKLRMELNSKRGALKVVKREIDELTYKIVGYKQEDRIWIANRKRLDGLEDQEKELTQDIAKLDKLLADPERDKLSLEQFLNLSKNAIKTAKSPIPEVKDAFCRKIFLNLTVDEEKVASYQLKPPFDVLLKHRQQLLGRNY